MVNSNKYAAKPADFTMADDRNSEKAAAER
jgi:hypothetical protein